MRNKYFDELVTENDLFYVCFMIEKTARFSSSTKSICCESTGI